MTVEEDIAVLAAQDALLRFQAFDANTAWALGSLLREKVLAKGIGATMEIEIAGQLVFACATPGATPSQAEWIRRKRNSVRRFGKSSYLLGRTNDHEGEDFEKRHVVSFADYAIHGGGFPIYVVGVGAIGSVVLSGLPQRQDHGLVIEALAELLGVKVPVLS